MALALRPLRSLALGALTTACSNGAAPPSAPVDGVGAASRSAGVAPHDRPDAAAERERLRAAERALSDAMATKGTIEGLLPALADDATLLVGGHEPLRGRAAIRRYLEGAYGGAARVRWTTVRADVSAAGDMGYTLGWSRDEPPRPGPEGEGGDEQYIAVWRKRGGQWALAVNLRNPSKTPATATAAPELGAPPPATRTSRADARREIIAADAAFAQRSIDRGTGDAFTAYAHDDVALLGGGFLFGREAVAARYNRLADRATLAWTPVEADAAESGELGYSIGRSVAKVRGEGGAVETYYGKYLSVWRNTDAGWRFVTDGGNDRPTPPAADLR